MADNRNATNQPPRRIRLRLRFQHWRRVLLPVPSRHSVQPRISLPCRNKSASESASPLADWRPGHPLGGSELPIKIKSNNPAPCELALGCPLLKNRRCETDSVGVLIMRNNII